MLDTYQVQESQYQCHLVLIVPIAKYPTYVYHAEMYECMKHIISIPYQYRLAYNARHM